MKDIINIDIITECFRTLLQSIGCNVEPINTFIDATTVYSQLKKEHTIPDLAKKFCLNEQEYILFDKIINISSQRFKHDLDENTDKNNNQIAYYRFLFWLETISRDISEISIPEGIESNISETLGQKQIRAIELVIRSLINEKYDNQDLLEYALLQKFREEKVDRWKSSADKNDILSGTSFAELASYFVSKEIFPSCSKFYEETGYLKLFKSRKKTAQNYLEDIRRIRNTFAHYREVSNIQIKLISLYYEEFLQPIQHGFDNGETSVNPSAILQVSDEELDEYFADLKEDVASIKDNIDALQQSLEKPLTAIHTNTQHLKKESQNINKKVIYIGIGVVILVLTSFAGIYMNFGIHNISEEIISKQNDTKVTLRGIVANPLKPEDHYHNARIYEQDGDYINARSSYLLYFSANLNYLDPHIRYQEFLKVQKGRAAARNLYNGMAARNNNPIVRLAKILLSEDKEKISELKTFITTHPDIGPAHYLLSNLYSENHLGSQSLSDKRQERKALEHFLLAVDNGQFLKYFVDHERAANWIEDARTRLAAVKILGDKILDTPVRFTSQYSNSGWAVNVSIGEPIRKIEYKTTENEAYIDNGLWDYYNPETGSKIPMDQIKLPLGYTRGTLFVKYWDINNNVRGPFKFYFDRDEQIIAYQKWQLMQMRQEWVRFRTFGSNKQSIHFNVMDYPCAILNVHYGLNDLPLNQNFEMPICDIDHPNRHGGLYFKDYHYNNLMSGPSIESISLQIEFRDGTSSDIVTIKNPNFKGE